RERQHPAHCSHRGRSQRGSRRRTDGARSGPCPCRPRPEAAEVVGALDAMAASPTTPGPYRTGRYDRAVRVPLAAQPSMEGGHALCCAPGGGGSSTLTDTPCRRGDELIESL